MDNILHIDLPGMAGLNFDCTCGKNHSVDIKRIVIEENIADEIISTLDSFKDSRVFMLSDNNTYEIYGKTVEALLIKNAFSIKAYTFNSKHPLVPDEKALGRILVEIGKDTGLIVAVGSGSINDLARMISCKLDIPYVIIGTAPSMDGYASTVSPLIIDGFKVTYEAVYPYAIFADTSILRKAPDKMIQAGFGDILGKFTALADWELSRTLKDEYYCSTSARLVKNALKKCVDNVEGISGQSNEAIKYLTEALILSGVAMGLVGNSRPASGAEHHLAHYWEVYALANGLEHPLHGNSVGVGTVVSAYIYNMLKEQIGLDIEVPDPEYIISLLKKIGACSSPFELGIRRDVFKESVVHAMKIRPRYTVFHLAKDHGKLENFADFLTRKFYD